MSALLPCPFCGGVNPGLWYQDIGVKSFPRVNCGACGSGAGFSPKWSDDDAIAAWNRRATPAEVETLRVRVERLEKALAWTRAALVIQHRTARTPQKIEAITMHNERRTLSEVLDATRAALENRT